MKSETVAEAPRVRWFRATSDPSSSNALQGGQQIQLAERVGLPDWQMHSAIRHACMAITRHLHLTPSTSDIAACFAVPIAAAVATRPHWVSRSLAESEAKVLPMLREQLARSLAAQEADLSNLPEDWDGYGAEPLAQEAVTQFVDELREMLRGVNPPAPQLIPGGDGSIQAEWHLPDAQVFYQADDQGDRFLSVAVGSDDHIYFGTEARELLPGVATALTKLHDKRSAKDPEAGATVGE